MDELHEHLEASLADVGTEAEVLNVLDRFGDPHEVARAALAEEGVQPSWAWRWSVAEWLAIFLLNGWFLGPLGWPVGLVLLWRSKVWELHHKVLGTLILPLGWYVLLTALARPLQGCLGSTPVCGGSWARTALVGTAVVATLLAPLATATMLAVRLMRHRRATAL